MTKFSGFLSFGQIVCSQCGEKRVVGIRCPTCGDAPDEREVDPVRQWRQALAKRITERLDRPLPSPSSVPPALDGSGVWASLSELVESTLEALFAAVADPGEKDRLNGVVDSFTQLEADAASVVRLRPWIATWKSVDDVLSRIRAVVQLYLRAISADSPMDAQRAANDAQQALNRAGEPAGELARRLKDWSSVESASSPEEAAAELARQAFEHSSATNIQGFDRSGAAIYERLTGQTGCPQGLGFGLALIAAEAEGPFDSDRFWTVAETVSAVLGSDTTWLARTVRDQQWIDDIHDALIRQWDSATLQQGALAAVRNERQLVRAMLDSGQDLVEGPGKRYIAVLLAALKGKDYSSYRGQSAGALINAANDQLALRDLILGLDRAIRVASAHDEFQLVGTEAILLNQGIEVERMTVPELTDRVLAGVESINAIGLAILCSAVAVGADFEALMPAQSDLMVPAGALSLILAGFGWRGTQTSLVGNSVEILGEPPVTGMNLGQVASLVPYLPDTVEELTLIGGSTSAAKTMRGPLAPMRRFARAEGTEGEIALVEAHSLWTLNSEPLTSRDQFRKVLSIFALQALAEDGQRSANSVLRTIIQSARRLGDEELVTAISGVMSYMRLLIGGARPPEIQGLEQLSSWASKRVPRIR